MLAQYFPDVKVIANNDNVGFSKANNQGFKIVNSEYVLILNPDTIIQEDTIQKCYDYHKSHPGVGAIGVRMIDGKGQFLPESKRGFPTPLNALYKMLRVSSVFPKSSIFNRYYLGHLDENQTNEVDVLTGAFMWVRNDVLHTVGGFDEDYFMYGEDIELSYQINSKGYKIVYLPETSIIHFKGESTKKVSFKYLKNFYGAMGIYAKKRNSNSGFLWSLILQLGIFFSALTFLVKSIFGKFIRPLIDIAQLYVLGKGLQTAWGYLYFKDSTYYQEANSNLTLLALVSVMIILYYIFGQYDKRHNLKHLGIGFLIGTLAMFTVYSLMPSDLRFSRVVLLMIAFLSPFVLYISRRIYNHVGYGKSAFNLYDSRRIAIVGSKASCMAVNKIGENYSDQGQVIGHVTLENYSDSLGTVHELNEIVDSRNINEIIFCRKDLSSDFIFQSMATLGNRVSYKLANDDNKSILGSDYKDKAGEWYALDIYYKIDQMFHIRLKHLFDIVMSIVFILGFPVLFLITEKRTEIYSNIFKVLLGNKTWIGYDTSDQKLDALPPIKKGVLELDASGNKSKHETNLYYARNYNVWLEMEMLFKLGIKNKR
jgi:GT2 family glycosyltransferase/Ca2+/Na+ antiporter